MKIKASVFDLIDLGTNKNNVCSSPVKTISGLPVSHVPSVTYNLILIKRPVVPVTTSFKTLWLLLTSGNIVLIYDHAPFDSVVVIFNKPLS